MTTTVTLTVEMVLAAKRETQAAIVARDAIDNCFSPEWRAAHAEARAACGRDEAITRAAYAQGLIPKPYWV